MTVRPRTIALAVAMVAMALVCVRAGSWQFDRWRQRGAQAARLRAALAAPVLEWSGGAAPADRRLAVRGTFDERHQVLVSDRWRDDVAGVEVATPLVLASGGAVVVNRGWLASSDAIHAAPDSFPVPGPRRVIGLAEPLPEGPPAIAWERMRETGGATLWSARALDLASLRARIPQPLEPFVLRALPGDSAPPRPAPEPPRTPDPAINLSYVVQWTLFALGFAGGAAFLVVRDARAPRDRPPGRA